MENKLIGKFLTSNFVDLGKIYPIGQKKTKIYDTLNKSHIMIRLYLVIQQSQLVRILWQSVIFPYQFANGTHKSRKYIFAPLCLNAEIIMELILFSAFYLANFFGKKQLYAKSPQGLSQLYTKLKLHYTKKYCLDFVLKKTGADAYEKITDN